MKILVIGANGQIGKILVNKMHDLEEFTPLAMVRKAEQVEAFRKQGIEAVLGDLEGTVDELTQLFTENQPDAIVFTAGSGGKTGADKTMMVDLDGAVKSMKAADKAGIKRYVMVSAFGVDRWHEPEVPAAVKDLSYYSAAKYYADLFLEHTDLDYTILRPTALTNEAATTKIEVAQEPAQKTITRADVAQTIIETLKNKQTIRRAITISNGALAIDQALNEAI